MNLLNIPFTRFGSQDVPRPWLPVTIINPDTNQKVKVYGLIDTGADECAFPANFVTQDILIDFMPNLHIPLLGVKSFLSNFLLTIDSWPNIFFEKEKIELNSLISNFSLYNIFY